jgi:hypothetical protein
MSETTPEYGKNYDNLKFVRLRGSCPDDLIGFVTYKEECIVIEKPLRVEMETIFEEGRQIIAMQEYLPQLVIELKEIEIPLEDILFVSPVKKEFIEQYEYVSDFFYTDESEKKAKLKAHKDSVAETAGKMEKVVSILEAMQAKKDKPVH